eukprot:3429359-Rhodomonas_salina.2
MGDKLEAHWPSEMRESKLELEAHWPFQVSNLKVGGGACEMIVLEYNGNIDHQGSKATWE